MISSRTSSRSIRPCQRTPGRGSRTSPPSRSPTVSGTVVEYRGGRVRAHPGSRPGARLSRGPDRPARTQRSGQALSVSDGEVPGRVAPALDPPGQETQHRCRRHLRPGLRRRLDRQAQRTQRVSRSWCSSGSPSWSGCCGTSCEWYYDRFVLTNKRVMLVEGVVARKVAMMPLTRVTDMKYTQSPLGRVARLRHVRARVGRPGAGAAHVSRTCPTRPTSTCRSSRRCTSRRPPRRGAVHPRWTTASSHRRRRDPGRVRATPRRPLVW